MLKPHPNEKNCRNKIIHVIKCLKPVFNFKILHTTNMGVYEKPLYFASKAMWWCITLSVAIDSYTLHHGRAWASFLKMGFIPPIYISRVPLNVKAVQLSHRFTSTGNSAKEFVRRFKKEQMLLGSVQLLVISFILIFHIPRHFTILESYLDLMFNLLLNRQLH